MKTLMIFLLMLRITYQPVIAQHYNFNDKLQFSQVMIEGGVSIGAINALTDVGGRKGKGNRGMKDLTWNTSRPAYGLGITATYRNSIGLRIEALRGTIEAADSSLKKINDYASGRYWRNLSFKTAITEFLLALEIHPRCFKYDYYDEAPAWSPYLMAGLGYFLFNPRAMIEDQWYDLQPLRTEGQGLPGYEHNPPYSRRQFNLAGGLGLRYQVSNKVNLRVELLRRFLHTDYLDDVSTYYPNPDLLAAYHPLSKGDIAKRLANRSRELNAASMLSTGDPRGNPGNNDAYFTVLFKLGFRISRFGR